jgi:hypothetical protein
MWLARQSFGAVSGQYNATILYEDIHGSVYARSSTEFTCDSSNHLAKRAVTVCSEMWVLGEVMMLTLK